MRLDKMIVSTGIASRSQVSKAAKFGEVLLNGVPCRKPDTQVDTDTDTVVYKGQTINYNKYTYIMLNKPDGYVSATEDSRLPVVTQLLTPELQKIGIFPCGRLDRNTVGLMLLTNNGELSHQLLLPRKHVAKSYRFEVKFPLSAENVDSLCAGVDIGGYITKPCKVELDGAQSGVITITEGKYHQIKFMMEAVHNQITYLERISFGSLTLDSSLERGRWRYLTESEIQSLKACTESENN